MRPDHSRLVSVGPNRGYLERPLSTRPGFVERTYVVGGRSEVRVYRTFSYHNVIYYRYVPAIYYQPGFYAWAYDPWAAAGGLRMGMGRRALVRRSMEDTSSPRPSIRPPRCG